VNAPRRLLLSPRAAADPQEIAGDIVRDNPNQPDQGFGAAAAERRTASGSWAEASSPAQSSGGLP
jgi:hypothetical protein